MQVLLIPGGSIDLVVLLVLRQLLDHLIFAAGREAGSEPYYSFLEKGVL